MEQHNFTPAGSTLSDPAGTAASLSPIPQLTELFGPCGVGWWYEIPCREIYTDPATCQKGAFLDIRLFYIDPDTGKTSQPIPATGGAALTGSNGFLSPDCYRAALFDALSLAVQTLGIGEKTPVKPKSPNNIPPEPLPKGVSPRKALILRLRALGMEPGAYALEKGLTRRSTDEDYLRCLKELCHEA